MPPTAYFASRRAELFVVEKSAIPQYEGGRQIGVTPGKYHHFEDHRCKVEGQTSIDFMRERETATDGPGLWEISAYDAIPAIELLSELATASRDRVAEILEEESGGPNRPEIIEVAERLLERYAESDVETSTAST